MSPLPTSHEGAAIVQPSASYSIVIRARLPSRAGAFGQVATAIGDTGAILGAIDLVKVEKGMKVREITVSCIDAAHGERVVDAVREIDGVTVESVLDRTFQMHQGGKIQVSGKIPVKTRDDLSMAYTPGVARVCNAIHQDVERAWSLTVKGNMVAVVSDGTAVLGLGDIGPEAAMPVMEGKAMLFKEFAGVDAFPLCLDTTDVDEIVGIVRRAGAHVRRHQPGGHRRAALLRDRASAAGGARHPGVPRRPARNRDRRPRGAAQRAARGRQARGGRRGSSSRAPGRPGMACANIILAEGATNVIVCDIEGALYSGRPDLDPERAALAERTNPRREQGMADELLAGADVYLGLSGPGAVSPAAVRTMASGAVVFAMANPTPEVQPEDVSDHVRIMATGRSDYPNQINNVLAFPGVFRGALDVRATTINEEMKLAAARAIASIVSDDELDAEYIIPSAFNRDVAPAVAEQVAKAAERSGVARRFLTGSGRT